MVVVEMRNQTVVWHQEAHKKGIRLPREIRVILPIGIICITIWGHWVLACIGPRHWHALSSNLSLREKLGSVLLGDQWIDN